MPTKQMESQRIVFSVNDEVIGELKAGGMVEIQGVNILGSNCDESVETTSLSHDRTFDIPFTMERKERKKLAKFLRTYLYGANNWRRLHGLPVIRGFRK